AARSRTSSSTGSFRRKRWRSASLACRSASRKTPTSNFPSAIARSSAARSNDGAATGDSGTALATLRRPLGRPERQHLVAGGRDEHRVLPLGGQRMVLGDD